MFSTKASGIAESLLEFESFLDELIESGIKLHLGLKDTLDRILPAAAKYLSAESAIVRTLDEELKEAAFSWGGGPVLDAARTPPGPSAKVIGRHLWVSGPLDVAGQSLGTAAFAFNSGDDPELKAEYVRVFREELDAVLWNIKTADFKQKLVVRVTRALMRPIFARALDEAVSALRQAIAFERLVILHVDESALAKRSLHYRVYAGGKKPRCTHHSGGRPLPKLEEAVRSDGIALLSPDRHRVARALNLPYAVETLFIAGITRAECLGQLIISTPSGLDMLGRDLLTVFANSVSQRLIDYRRERRHLAQYFSPESINRLLSRESYLERHLTPRKAEIAILYADICGFTRLSEAIADAQTIGRFIDRWSAQALRIVWKHGGVFDKMVGDCVIAHFGPPFYQASSRRNVLAALRTAAEIQEYTRSLEKEKEIAAWIKTARLPGLGVAVGVNYCEAAVGLFGPHQDYTAFGSGMNQTARLQGVAGFRETLVMAPARAAVKRARGVRFGPLAAAKVKNVAQALKYCKLLGIRLGDYDA